MGERRRFAPLLGTGRAHNFSTLSRVSPSSVESMSAESEARKALNRLRRAAEKAEREMAALQGALAHAEGSDFPAERYEAVLEALRGVIDFTEEEAQRLQEKILHAGGLEPGRVRRG